LKKGQVGAQKLPISIWLVKRHMLIRNDTLPLKESRPDCIKGYMTIPKIIEVNSNHDGDYWPSLQKELLESFPITNGDWIHGTMHAYGSAKYYPWMPNSIMTHDMKVKLDPWNRKFIPWRDLQFESPTIYEWKPIVDASNYIEWRYTTVVGKRIGIYKVRKDMNDFIKRANAKYLADRKKKA